ncbi:MAG TPA: ABC transporter ATP-binding protein [Desulfotomaculum sp.]|nr:MAG: Abc transporter, ATP-binding protein [Desulfotomaculum sp. 46_80]HAG10881.1 ABC transporter ATP-binding protein [Desulfotomaculum sp.]HBY03069.1 ABC transporter ATP-binding protein [Desulfotomaculum sp.]
MINDITILPGFNKAGIKENFSELTLKTGETVSIIGPTGSGKTALITDIELLAQEDTSTGRKIFINGESPLDEYRYNPSMKPISMITQNTKCFADLTTEDFLELHARSRGIKGHQIISDTIELANNFTGEKIIKETKVTILSGGQTRSLLIADAVLIGLAPVILLDEIENAGIFKQEVLEMIQSSGKIVIFVTHDPVIALLTKKRIIMKNGGVTRVINQNELEVKTAHKLMELDKKVSILRENLRSGNILTNELAVNFA